MSNTPNDKPNILNCKTLAQSRLFKIEQVALEFSNGTQCHYERIIAPGAGAVLIIPVIDQQHVIMVREYAVGTERYELVFPKGKIDPGEDILQAANRECMEETGYRANRLTQLGKMTIAPGYLGLITHIVLAEELQVEKRQGDEPEALQQVICNINNITSIISNENLTEARSIAALYQVRDLLLNRRGTTLKAKYGK
ncbi:ADP compounds hydrolase NudE [hydrothermal vent metagenome]|uniref:ADP compounds hydrolase NudE n=1 Tax=hydrothermal vent metagenome TaxID=652676 RepID=A0A3B0XUB9_9ZZZZ